MDRRCNRLPAMQLTSAVRRKKVSFMVNERIDFLCLDKRMLTKAEKMGRAVDFLYLLYCPSVQIFAESGILDGGLV